MIFWGCANAISSHTSVNRTLLVLLKIRSLIHNQITKANMTLLESKSFSSIDSSETLVCDDAFTVREPGEDSNKSQAVLVKEIRNAVRGWVGSKVIIHF